jgi:hypothetical protein
VTTLVAVTFVAGLFVQPPSALAAASTPRISATTEIPSTGSGSASLSGLACASPTNCVAVGQTSTRVGAVAYGDPGVAGVGWTAISPILPGSVQNLDAVTCPSSTECVAVGSAGDQGVASIAHFVDGTWEWNNAVGVSNPAGLGDAPEVALSSVGCVTSAPASFSCVAVGVDSASGVALWTSTSDGGVTWSAATPVPVDDPSASTTSTYRSLQCVTPTSCLAVGDDASNQGIVSVATLTGVTWAWSVPTVLAPDSSLETDLTSVSCASATQCVSVGYDAHQQGVYSLGTDVSNVWSWTIATKLVPDSTGQGSLSDVACLAVPSTTCVALGTDSSGSTTTSTSTDLGSTWTRQTPVTSDGVRVGGVASNLVRALVCPSDSSCVAVGDDALSQGFALNSVDATTWSAETQLGTYAVAGPGQLSSVSCPSTSECVAVGSATSQDSVVTRSSDGGATWRRDTLLAHDTAGGDHVTSVTCPTVHLCVAVGYDAANQGVIWRSTNGAVTWATPIDVAPSTSGEGPLMSVQCPSANSCVAVGSNGLLASTGGVVPAGTTTFSLNAGASWSTEQTVSADVHGGGQLISLSCPSVSRCVAGGINASGLTTTTFTLNAGASWSADVPISADPSQLAPLTSLSCPSTSLCVMVGQDSSSHPVVSRSLNGGLSWSPPSSLATDATGRDTPLAVACATTVRCVATGIDGFTQPTVSYSRDGGRLWSTPITISSDAAGGEFMPGLSCASVTQCVAVGHDEATQGVALSISFEATVYFASHGGQGFMRPQSAWTRTHLHAATFTRSGYQFKGWSLVPGGRAAFNNKGVYSFRDNLNLYAVWRKAKVRHHHHPPRK